MGRKKKQPEPAVEATLEATKTKPVRADLTPEVHRLLRLAAAIEEKPMAVLVREIVEQYVRDHQAAKGGK